MKDYTIIANNKSKTKITFEYDHGLPFKHSLRPKMEYGEWKNYPQKALIKVHFDDEELDLFTDKEKITCSDVYIIGNEYWFDLEDVYLIVKKDDYLNQKFKEYNIVIAFLHNNKLINGLEF